MNTYVYKSKFGIAVVNASSKSDALAKLKAREGDEYLSFKASSDYFEILSQEEGVVAYFVN